MVCCFSCMVMIWLCGCVSVCVSALACTLPRVAFVVVSVQEWWCLGLSGHRNVSLRINVHIYGHARQTPRTHTAIPPTPTALISTHTLALRGTHTHTRSPIVRREMNLRSLSVADSGRLARRILLINKIETEGQRCAAWPLSVIKTHSLNSTLNTKPHIIQLLPSANTIQWRRVHCDDLRRVKMRYYNKGDVVYMVIALTRIQWVRSYLQKLLPWTKGIFINLKPLLRSLLYNENIPLNGTGSLLLLYKHIENTDNSAK